jgi:hypothetical protein
MPCRNPLSGPKEKITFSTTNWYKYKENPTIGNVIRFKITELYKNSGQANKALDELNAIVEADRKK